MEGDLVGVVAGVDDEEGDVPALDDPALDGVELVLGHRKGLVGGPEPRRRGGELGEEEEGEHGGRDQIGPLHRSNLSL